MCDLELATLKSTVGGSLWPWPLPLIYHSKVNGLPVRCEGSQGFTAVNLTAAASARAEWATTPAYHACVSATLENFCTFASAAGKQKW